MVFLAVFLSDSLKNFAEETNYVELGLGVIMTFVNALRNLEHWVHLVNLVAILQWSDVTHC